MLEIFSKAASVVGVALLVFVTGCSRGGSFTSTTLPSGLVVNVAAAGNQSVQVTNANGRLSANISGAELSVTDSAVVVGDERFAIPTGTKSIEIRQGFGGVSVTADGAALPASAKTESEPTI